MPKRREIDDRIARSVHRCDQPISLFGDRLDVRRLAGRVAQRLAQLDNDLRGGVVANDHTGPYGGKELIAACHFAGSAREVKKHRHRFGLELHDLVISTDLVQVGCYEPVTDLQRHARPGFDAFADHFHR